MPFLPSESSLTQKVTIGLSLAASLLLLMKFMITNSMDVLMADRVDTWIPLINGNNFWEGFTAQHGPHRLGLLFILSKIGYTLGNGFDTRYDLYINAIVIWLMVPLGLWVKYKITQKFNWSDIFIPFLITASWQWATLVINPHIHVMLPLFTLLFMALLLSKQKDNLTISSLLFFIATFSVYAIFPALIFVGIQVFKWIKAKSFFKTIILVFVAIITLIFYYHNFKLISLDSTGAFNLVIALKAPFYLWSHFFYLPKNWIAAPLILGILLFIYKYLKTSLVFNSKTYAFILLCISLLIFVGLQSIGRSGDNLASFSSTRYYTELVLIIWIISIVTSNLKNQNFTQIGVIILFSWVIIKPGNPYKNDPGNFKIKALKVKACVLKTQDFENCNAPYNLNIYFSKDKTKVIENWVLLQNKKEAFQANR